MTEEQGDLSENKPDRAEELSASEIVGYQESEITSPETEDIIEVRLREAAYDAPFVEIAAYKLEQDRLKLEKQKIEFEAERSRQELELVDNQINGELNFRKLSLYLGLTVGLVMALVDIPGAFIVIAVSIGLGKGMPDLFKFLRDKLPGSGKGKNSDGQ
ncbi:hypothetical protein Pse7367_2112 [Thalassoporum mexicanum PCC 7367]|uniref:hypothetical protein n=1 Tax=Thalassoporum mexicanum TaxID=3457544 RepID=UPI00029FB5F1|nr:hypothetical protein [Pseudanabaena sp. PCC 7367]AFY70379.1 hypothetical protein Pse7367_2112 [Pseudanabaena sp. PCC 7367]